MENFSHFIGATDRYNGYRNNLTRNPIQPEYETWATFTDKKRLVEAPKFTTPSFRQYSHSFNRKMNV